MQILVNFDQHEGILIIPTKFLKYIVNIYFNIKSSNSCEKLQNQIGDANMQEKYVKCIQDKLNYLKQGNAAC